MSNKLTSYNDECLIDFVKSNFNEIHGTDKRNLTISDDKEGLNFKTYRDFGKVEES